ncbi:MAG TPA: RNA methyltransferase [Ignavibacteria bacterium]|nr:RNA methyltransferase [Ignavibacteria bacterium]
MTKNEISYYKNLLKDRKFRAEQKKFIIEGAHLIEEAIKSKYYKNNIEKIFIRKDFEDKQIINELSGKYELEYLSSKEFEKISDTVKSQGISAILNITDEDKSKETGNIILALDRINDPGNLGTILRTAYWFGVELILLSKDSVDVYNPKTVRASQGAMFNLKIRTELDLIREVKNYRDYKIFLTDLSASKSLEDVNINKSDKIILAFGNEASGLSTDLLSLGFEKIKIKGFSDCESLNLSVSAGITLYYFRNKLS